MTISCSIGHSAAGTESLEDKPLKAHLVWKDGMGHEIASREFDEAELRQEITELEQRGEDTAAYRDALVRLLELSAGRDDGT